MTFAPRQIFAVASLSTLVLLASCGKFFVDENQPSGGTTCSSDCIYIGNYDTTSGNADVAAFAAVDPLTVVMSVNDLLGDNPTSMALGTNGYLYTSSADDGNTSVVLSNIYAIPIESGGSLGTKVTALSEQLSFYADAIAIDPSGAYLAIAGVLPTSSCATGYAAAIAVYNIGTGGVLGTATYAPAANTNACLVGSSIQSGAIAFTPDKTKMYVAYGSFGIVGYSFDDTSGVPTLGTVLAGTSAASFNDIAVDSQSAYLFATESGAGGGLYQFAIGADTTLTQVGAESTTSADLYPIVVDASNTYVYAAQETSGQIYGYTFGSAGLTAISGSPFSPSATSSGTYGMVTDSGAKYVITTSTSGPNLQEYTIGTGGALATASTGTTGSTSTYSPVVIAISK